MGKPVIQAKKLHKEFLVTGTMLRKRKLVAVDEVNLTIDEGECLGLVGESGCGKSTVGRILLNLLEPTSGSVYFNGIDLTSASEKVINDIRLKLQMVFQDPYDSLNPRKRAEDIIREPLDLHTSWSLSQKKERVLELIDLVGLKKEHLSRYPHQFSGGQQQRIGIARAVVARPDFIVLDEPTSSLDVSVRGQVLELLKTLQEKSVISYLLISHDLSTIRYMAGHVAVMYLGGIVEYAHKRIILEKPRHPYTQALISAVPIPEPGIIRHRIRLKGEVPSPLNVPVGCKLVGRCHKEHSICQEKPPSLEEVATGHFVACYFPD